MRGNTGGTFSVDIVTRAVLEEFPELDAARVKAAIERGAARVASASMDTEGYRVVDLHLARVEASEESSERAQILRELSENLVERGDLDRALVVRLSAFSEAADPKDLEPLLRLARVTKRWAELPLDAMNALIDIHDDGAVQRLTDMATGWQEVGRSYFAADCLERVLLIAPGDANANEALELFYRSTQEWPVLIDLLSRRTVHVEQDHDRAELYREIAQIYERELDDESGALDAYQEADRLAPGHPEVLDALARLSMNIGVPDEEALAATERLAEATKEPKARARVLTRAAEIAKLHDWDKAQKLFERALIDDPDLASAVDGFVGLLRDRGQLAEVLDLLVIAARRPAFTAERARWLADAADYAVATGDVSRAKELYREARKADPDNAKAGLALVELSSDDGSLVELAPLLDELCRTTEDPSRLRGYLLQRSKVAAELGDRTGARIALSRAVDLDPTAEAPRRELADMLFDAGMWAKARPLLEGLLEDEDLLPPARRVELHHRVALCAKEVGDKEAAIQHVGIMLALQPDHRVALQMRTELDNSDPFAHAADQLMLANLAPPEEKATRFANLGDRYTELGDRATAREMYREALAHRPGDHLLLTKFLGLVTDDGDWSYAIDVVQRLIDTEADPKVRARYRHLAAMIARDELADHERSSELFEQSLADDPLSFPAADELEALLAAQPDRDALMRFYYQRLEQVRTTEGRDGERLRLWDRLGDLCAQLGRNDDAIAAFEVGMSLAPDDLERRERLADLAFEAGTKHDATAIAQHQAVLRASRKRVGSYQALRALYLRTAQPEKARAVDDAMAFLTIPPAEDRLHERIDALFEPGKSTETIAVARPHNGVVRPLANEDWIALARLDVDLQLSALFGVVAPAFAVERARMRPPTPVPAKEHELPPHLAKIVGQVITAFGIARPPIYLERDQLAPCKVVMRARGGQLVPVLIVGRAAIDRTAIPGELAFQLARQLADLRTDRIARLLCPRAGELAQIIELASGQPGDDSIEASQARPTQSHAGRWMATSLHPVELDQALAIGARLRERGVSPMTAALHWLAATERSADRIGLCVIGDLKTAMAALERDPAAVEAGRPGDLVWGSITEEVLGVRGRIEAWGTPSVTASS